MERFVQGETLRLVFSHDIEQPLGATVRWLLALWECCHKSNRRLWRDRAPISLELLSLNGQLSYQVHMRSALLARVTRQVLSAHCPGIEFEPAEEDPFGVTNGAVATISLRRPGWLDLEATKPDALPGVLGAVHQDTGIAALQLLLQPSWIRTEEGSIPAFWLTGRIIAPSRSRVGVIAGALGQHAGLNGVGTSRVRNLRPRDLVAFRERRWTRRWLPPGLPATPAQIAALYHPPAKVRAVAHLLGKTVLRTTAPATTSGITLGLGRSNSGSPSPVRLQSHDLLRHAVIIGPSGSGKSTLLAHLARELADAGHGLTVLDPHGSLATEIARSLPDAALERAALLRFADTNHVIGLNPFAIDGGHEGMVTEELVDILRRVLGSGWWGPMLDLTLRHAAAATIATKGTLLESARILEDPAFREQVLGSVENPETLRFFSGLGDANGFDRRLLPAVHRLQRLLAVPWLRNTLAQRRSSLSFTEAFERREVLLLDLSGLGVANAKLIGLLLLLLIRGAALKRNPGTARERPHFVLVDEASWFLGDTVAELLDQLRKFGVGIVMALQRVSQISKENVRSAVFANAATTVTFRTPDYEDAAFLARHFASELIGAVDLQRLPRFEAYAQLNADGERLEPAWLKAPEPAEEDADRRKRELLLREQGIRRFTVPRAQVEAELRERERSYDHGDEPEIRVVEAEDDDALPANPA